MLVEVIGTGAVDGDGDHGVGGDRVNVSDVVGVCYEGRCGVEKVGNGGRGVVKWSG